MPTRGPIEKVRVIDRFVRFVKKSLSALDEMAQVQGSMAAAFCRAELARGIAPKTYNHVVTHLRSVFRLLRKEAGWPRSLRRHPAPGRRNHLQKALHDRGTGPDREKGPGRPFIYRLIVTRHVHGDAPGRLLHPAAERCGPGGRFITVKTSKTQDTVQILIFPLLRGVLEGAGRARTASAVLLFPDLEAHDKINSDHLTDRVRRVMKAAGFFNPKDDEERAISRGAVQLKRGNGLRRASLRDFHSFRVTWVTIALTAGVPLEIVQRVTGHRMAGIVMRHYFQPGQEDFRRTLASKLPVLFGGDALPPKPVEATELAEKLRGMTAETWESVRANSWTGSLRQNRGDKRPRQQPGS